MNTATKTCAKCGLVLPVSEFYRNPTMADGTLNTCKKCQSLYTKQRQKLPEVQARRREWEKGSKYRTWLSLYRKAKRQTPEHKMRRKAYEEKYKQRPEVKAEVARRQKLYLEKHPQRYSARWAVNKAVRYGRLEKLPCVVCGNPKSQGHHEDYSRPLEVEWLCRECHRQRHAEKENVTEYRGTR